MHQVLNVLEVVCQIAVSILIQVLFRIVVKKVLLVGGMLVVGGLLRLRLVAGLLAFHFVVLRLLDSAPLVVVIVAPLVDGFVQSVAVSVNSVPFAVREQATCTSIVALRHEHVDPRDL